MRKILASTGFIAAMFACGHAAAQTMMSINSVTTFSMPQAECLRLAPGVLQNAGFRQFGTTRDAIWAEKSDNRSYIGVVYCLATRDVAVIAVHGPSTSVTHPMVDRIVAEWNNATR